MKPDYFIIPQLVAASLTGELTEEEQAYLDNWREASESNRRLYAQMLDAGQQNLIRSKFDQYDREQNWTGFLYKKEKTERKRLYRRISRYAAAILLPVCLISYVYISRDSQTATHDDTERNKVILRMADKEIDLTETSGEIAAGSEQAVIVNDKNMLSYQDAASENSDVPVYNEIIVPRGMRYQLILADGTSVHINADTRVRFPARFTGKVREVELVGEAYFNVTRDDNKPFIVKTEQYNITVLGTKFNISAYRGESCTRTVLVEGSVALSGRTITHTIVLEPNQLFTMDKESKEWEVENVDAVYHTAWKEGRFRFLDERLEDIMHQITRWYDVDVMYVDDEVRDFQFGFFANRNETVEPILRMFEQTGKVLIERDGKIIKIRRGR